MKPERESMTVEEVMEQVNDDDFFQSPQKVLNCIVAAAHIDKLALVETTDRDGSTVQVLAMVWDDEQDGGDGNGILPLARLFAGSPFDSLNPPSGARVVDKRGEGAVRH